MGSFQQPGYMPQADWNHEGVAQIYAPDFPGNEHPEGSGYSFTSDSTTGSTLVYGYGPQSIPATDFHLPGAPASAGKHLTSHRSATTTGVEEEKHSRRIKRTRTVGPFALQWMTMYHHTDMRQACEECRKRKQKCDGMHASLKQLKSTDADTWYPAGGEPCQSCDEQSTDCKYRDVPPTKYARCRPGTNDIWLTLLQERRLDGEDGQNCREL